MSRRRLENLDPERQERLFQSATEEFLANGYDTASLNRILEKSGMSKSSLYYYFDDKADLFATVLERAVDVLMKQTGGVDLDTLTAEDFWPTFERLYRRAIAIANRNTWIVRFGQMFYRLRGNPHDRSATGRMFRVAQQWVDRVITRGQVLGMIRDDLPNSLLVDTTFGLLEALDRWMLDHWDEMDASERLDTTAEHIALIRRLLGAPTVAD